MTKAGVPTPAACRGLFREERAELLTITYWSVEKVRTTMRRFYTHAMRRLAVLIVAVEVVTIAALYWFGRHFV